MVIRWMLSINALETLVLSASCIVYMFNLCLLLWSYKRNPSGPMLPSASHAPCRQGRS
jgi:hypothetical protein